jgi:nicotinate-nucleotide adenylyltransferase
MRIGIFGGTFDPVHVGHLVMAEQCREQGRLDEVWFVPAARPPHKAEHDITPFDRRVEMLSLAIAGHPAFRINELERHRAGPSFTVDTVEELQQQHPGNDLHWILGSDSLYDLPGWRSPARIVELAGLLIVPRPSFPVWPEEQLRGSLKLPNAALRMLVVHSPLMDVSSRDLRRRAAEGRSLRYLTPRAVECYIEQHHLYRNPTPP